MTQPYPDTIDDISALWFGECLSERFPGTAVTSLERGTAIHGTATKIEYHLRYNEAGNRHGLPPTLWLKCGLETQIPEQAVHSAIEAAFFRDLVPALDINVPVPYATAFAPDRSSGIVIYEDLNRRPVQFRKQNGSLSPAEMLQQLDMLASLHATFWRNPRLHEIAWLTPGGVIHSNGVLERFSAFWDYVEPMPRFLHVPDVLKDRERLLNANLALMADDIADPVCVAHGDPHIGNMFFDPDGRPGLLDWATVMLGSWAWDVAYAMVINQNVAQRRTLERGQLQHYLERLAALGVAAPSMDSAWNDYARHSVYMFNFVLCPPELQPEELCTQSAERACAAICDLEGLQRIEAQSRRRPRT